MPSISLDTLHQRAERICGLLNGCKQEALLLNYKPNVSYAAGFNAPDTYALITHKRIFLITDPRYVSDFKRNSFNQVKVAPFRSSVFNSLERVLTKEKVKTVHFESRHLTYAELSILKKLSGKTVRFNPKPKTLEPLRAVKETQEINILKEAAKITKKAFAFIEKKLQPGLTELEVAGTLESFIRKQGAVKNSFDIIVASGPNSAYPHASISQRVIKNNEPIIIDMGVTYKGYKSDLTRTFFLGKITPYARRVFKTVKVAQEIAIAATKPGISIKRLDQLARRHISNKGFKGKFLHSLGHGIGLEVHEDPGINKHNAGLLKENMVFTVEPGIYLDGHFGVRMEEMVLVTRNGVEVLGG